MRSPPFSCLAVAQTWIVCFVAIGRGNDIVCYAINHVANMVVGKKIEDFFADMGKTYDYREHPQQTLISRAGPLTVWLLGNA
jgi:hypothetical protein